MICFENPVCMAAGCNEGKSKKAPGERVIINL